MTSARQVSLALGLGAATVVAVACQDGTSPRRDDIGTPSFGVEGPPPPKECPSVKMTGGGRIDYPTGDAEKNPPASHQYQTFGAHVMQRGNGDGTCTTRGVLQWVDHRPGWRLGGRPLNLHSTAVTFAERMDDSGCADGALRWGGTLIVKNTGQEADFDVLDCDNGEPGAGNDAFEIFVPDLGYAVTCPNRRADNPPGCVLTGGNRQAHPAKP